MSPSAAVSTTIGLISICLGRTDAFCFLEGRASPFCSPKDLSTSLFMGLYDEPLPPRPPRKRKANNKKTPSDELYIDGVLENSAVLFEFDNNGCEKRNLLPSLGRRLDTKFGKECYMEPTDRLVKNLVEKTACNPADACWALEACKGDVQEAWLCISMARRLQLDDQRDAMNNEDSGFVDEDSYQVEMEEAFLKRRDEVLEDEETRLKRAGQKYQQDKWFGGNPDDSWLPTKNPRPIDDEPWFTG